VSRLAVLLAALPPSPWRCRRPAPWRSWWPSPPPDGNCRPVARHALSSATIRS